jgi:hypothetical protein
MIGVHTVQISSSQAFNTYLNNQERDIVIETSDIVEFNRAVEL